MSDVTVSVVESTTSVTVSNDVVDVSIVESPVTISTGNSGPQGASYNQGDPIYERIRNSTGSTLLKGQIVYLSGATGNHVNVSLALASGDATSARTIGWISENIANNAEGFVMMFGYLEGIDTSAASAVGDILYLSPTVPGGWTSTKPSAPQHMVYVGVCVRKNPSNGAVSVHIQNGYELGELHDVAISSPVNNQVLTYDSATDLWVNATNPADGVTSITATAPLTGGTITSTGSIGIDQTALSIAQSQVTNLVTDLTNTAKLNTANTFSVGGHVINNNAIGTVPLQVNAIAGQTADVLQVRNSSGTSYVAINNLGSLQWGSGSGSFLSGTNGRINVVLSDAASVGATVRGASGQTGRLLELQNNSGDALTWIGSAGQVRTSVSIRSISMDTVVGQLAIQSGNALTPTAILRGATSQTADLLQIQDSAATNLVYVNGGGGLFATVGIRATSVANLTTSGNSRISMGNGGALVDTSVAGNIPLQVQNINASPTGDLTRWLNNASGVLVSISSTGTIATSGNINSTSQVRVGTATSLGQLSVVSASAGTIGAVIRGAASQTANLQEWQDSAGTILSRVSSGGQFISNSQTYIGAGATSILNTRFNLATGSASVVGQVIRGAASQTADLQQWQNSAGAVLAEVTNGGALATTSYVQNVAGNTPYLDFTTANRMIAQTRDASYVGLIVKGATSQTANLTEWQNSAGTVVASIGNSGGLSSLFMQTEFGLAQLANQNSGGGLRLNSVGASTNSNPGASRALIYVKDGTDAGTLKLVVRAGATGAETTILDNIPT
jgi:hypothetical protein